MLQAVEGEIPKGTRNPTLFSLAGTMRERGMEEREILAALLEINCGRCKPPLLEREVHKIAAGVMRYEAGSEILLSLGDFHSYLPERKYIFAPTGALWPLASVNALLGKVGKGKKAVPANVRLDQDRAVQQMSWAPGRPKLIENELIADGGWFDKPGVKVFNRYKPPTIELGDPDGAEPWREHVELIYPGEAEHIILCLAHRVQRPGEKINHALVLQGAQGIG